MESILIVCCTLALALFCFLHQRVLAALSTLKKEQHSLQLAIIQNQGENREQQASRLAEVQLSLEKTLFDFGVQLEQRNTQNLAILQTTLSNNSQQLNDSFGKLTEVTKNNLFNLANEVNGKLSDGFAKTTATFTDIVKRLALIDNAQQKLAELSTNVISLQEILQDKRTRGAFGEVQLQSLIENIFPPENVKFQYTFATKARVDCLLILPPPTGNIAVDAKFPLENFQRYVNYGNTSQEKKLALQSFRQDVKKHIQDVAEKYIIPGETGSGALLFIPAEAVFAEIHNSLPDLVSLAQRLNVWLASPTTMMAILTTAVSVLKDHATKKHLNVIQEHLRMLSADFGRFDDRLNKLSRRLESANEEARAVQTSAKKITKRFQAIDSARVEELSEVID